MVNCVDTLTLTVPTNQASSLKVLLAYASNIAKQPSNRIKLNFLGQDGSLTAIESDSDLLALRYTVRNGPLSLVAHISKSRQEIMNEIISQCVGEYLDETYDDVIEREEERAVNKQIEEYLNTLYKRLVKQEEKEKIKNIEQEEINRYMSQMTSELVNKRSRKELPTRERRQRMRVSPQKQLFRRKEGHIEVMVGRILESMMPVMVKELSYRIVEELKRGDNIDLEDLRECGLNPEEY